MSFYQELARIALLGTERTSFSEEIERKLAAMQISEELSPAQQVLEAAAFQAQYHKIALPPRLENVALAPKSTDGNMPYISTTSVGHLAQVLDKKLLPALPEFTQTMEEAGKVFPPEYLPQLLDLSSTDFSFWNYIASGIGERGWWLIRQNPKWQQLTKQPYSSSPPSVQKRGASMEFVYKLKKSLNSNPLLPNQEHRSQLREVAFQVDLNKYDTLIDGWYLSYQFSHNWTQDVEQFLRILAFRKAMLEELRKV